MRKEITIKPNDCETLCLFGTHVIAINRGRGDSGEIVVYPCATGRLSIRFAKELYCCRLWFRDNEYIDVTLDDESDWGNIDTTNPRHPKWGNDVDGYRSIKKVELFDGVPEGTIVPLDEFSRDVDDFIIYHEA